MQNKLKAQANMQGVKMGMLLQIVKEKVIE